MAINDNWHVHAGRDCGTGCSPSFTFPVPPYSAWTFPVPLAPPPPRCPATTRHTPPHSLVTTGLQCKYEPGHDGDHAAYAWFGQGDVFWPQETPAPGPYDGSGERVSS